MRVLGRLLITVVLLGGVGWVGWRVWERYQEPAEGAAAQTETRVERAAPVEVGRVEHGTIERRRTISGTLEASNEVIVASKIAGRVERIGPRLADAVARDDVVVWLDDDEHEQAVRQAEAELKVASANLAEAEKALEIATRGLTRIETLKERGIASDLQYDQAIADKLAKEAALEVAKAQITRAEATRDAAKIRLGYTRVVAGWDCGCESRIVAERFVDEGATVAPNTPLYRIVELDPILGVIYVTEKDYANLAEGKRVSLTTDAYPGETFEGEVARIAPVFRRNTRQARVELTVPNADQRLRPGMFIRVTVVLERIEETTIVPVAALAERDDVKGVFVVDASGESVRWQPVTLGVQQGERVQVTAVEDGVVEGRVVVLGQQLVKDGSKIRIANDDPGSAAPGPAAE